MNIRELMLEEEHHDGWGSKEVRNFWHWLAKSGLIPGRSATTVEVPAFARERTDLEALYARYLIEKEEP